MIAFPIREFAKVAFPFGQGGWFVMLKAFFDDSGTHGNSEVVVWAGVFGTVDEFDRLESAWLSKLEKPLSNRPKLAKFSCRDCARGDGEFFGYGQGERDLLRNEMRQIIADSGVRPCAYAVPIGLYNEVLRGRIRRAYGPPDGIAFAACADHSLKVAAANSLPMAAVFDKGQKSPYLDNLLADAENRAEKRDVPVSYTYMAVADSAGLQAADTIATEHYWYSLELLHDEKAEMSAHFKSLVKKNEPVGYWLLRPELEEMRDKYRADNPLRDWLRSERGRQKERMNFALDWRPESTVADHPIKASEK